MGGKFNPDNLDKQTRKLYDELQKNPGGVYAPPGSEQVRSNKEVIAEIENRDNRPLTYEGNPAPPLSPEREALFQASVDILLSTFLPGYGESDDFSILRDPTSSPSDKDNASKSLFFGVILGGIGPNFGTLRRGKQGIAKAAAEARALESASARKMAVQEALEIGEINAATAQRAGVVRPPQHHVFPQAERPWFAERGVDIDKFTVNVDQGTHEALHYGGGPGKGGGWWNEQIMKTLTEREAALERKLTPQEIEVVGKLMMSRAKISDLPILPYKEAP